MIDKKKLKEKREATSKALKAAAKVLRIATTKAGKAMSAFATAWYKAAEKFEKNRLEELKNSKENK